MYQRTRFPVWICLSLVVLLLGVASAVSAQDMAVQDEHHIMTVRQSLHHDVSPAVRDMPTVNPNARARHEAEPRAAEPDRAAGGGRRGASGAGRGPAPVGGPEGARAQRVGARPRQDRAHRLSR